MEDLLKPILTLKEAADFLQISPKTLRRRVNDGAVPAEKIGGKTRFSRKRLEELFADKGEMAPAKCEALS